MSISREELLRQKALVESQLAWLNAKLAESHHDSPTTQATTPAADTPPPGSPPSTPDLRSPAPQNTPTSPGSPADASPGTLPTLQKLGCLLLALLICAGLLFLMFGLPYLIY